MGLFDTIHDFDGRFVTPDGRIVKSLQTKDLGASMGRFYIHKGKLFERASERSEAIEGRNLFNKLLVSKTQLTFCAGITDKFRGYATDYQGAVSYKEPLGQTRTPDQIHTQYPWLEWEIEIVKGRVMSVTPIRLETRVMIEQDLLKKGNIIQ